MGRKTWESIPPKFRPLDNRTNVILTRSNNSVPGVDADANANDPNSNVMVCTSLQQAVEKLQGMPSVGNVFIIGGGQVYEESIKSGLVNKVFYTEVAIYPLIPRLNLIHGFQNLPVMIGNVILSPGKN